MRRIIVREARPGMRAARAVYHPKDSITPLLLRGAELSVHHLVTLHELGIYDLWVEEPELSFLDDLHGPSFTPAQSRLADAIFRAFLRFAGVQGDGIGRHSLLRRHTARLRPFVTSLIHAATAVPGFDKFATEHDDLLLHSADVAVLSTLLAWDLEPYIADQRNASRDPANALHLAIGALFHDFGETLLPLEDRESRGLLMDPSSTQWQLHPNLAYSALRSHVHPSAASAILHHHQHFDGTGFGGDRSLAGPAIQIFARILHVADTFEQLRSPLGRNRIALQALYEMRQLPLRNRCDPAILAALIKLLPPLSPGMVVELNDRRQALILRTNAQMPASPEVQVLRSLDDALASPSTHGEILDLSQEPTLRITALGVTLVTTELAALNPPPSTRAA